MFFDLKYFNFLFSKQNKKKKKKTESKRREMLSKSACLSSRLVLYATLKSKLSSHQASSSVLFLQKSLRQNKSFMMMPQQTFATSAACWFNKTGEKKPAVKSIIQPSTDSSVLSDDLKKILAQTGEESAKQAEPVAGGEKANEGASGEAGGGMFSKEHAWKYSLSFFVALFGGSFLYILVDWGQPRLDENNQPVYI